jgi:hypothetical protein
MAQHRQLGYGLVTTSVPEQPRRDAWRGSRRTAEAKHAAQRLVIDGNPVLIHVAPGEERWFQSNPCTGWMVASRRLDMNRAGVAYVRFGSKIRRTVSLGSA